MRKSRRQDTRSEETERDQIQKLKAIIRNQTKEIARLRKELGKRDDVSDEYKDLLQESEASKAPRTFKARASCPKCTANINAMNLGKFTLETCTACEWRQRRLTTKEEHEALE